MTSEAERLYWNAKPQIADYRCTLSYAWAGRATTAEPRSRRIAAARFSPEAEAESS
jgi:hypothetical protein